MPGKQREKESREKQEPAQKNSFQRHPAIYVFSVFILVVIIVTFIGAPAVSGSSSRGRLTFGTYGHEEISYQPGNYFARQYDAIAQSLRDAGQGANLELQLRLAWREAFNRTVLHTAILQAADTSGVRVSEQKVDELIAVSPQFQENGRFSPSLYASQSSQERYNIRKFYREEQIFDVVVTDVLTGGKVSSAESDFIGTMAGPERSFQVVRFLFSDYPDSELISFARENAQIFTTLDLQVVTLATKSEAEQILSQARSGNPVDDLARTYSRDIYADQGGSMGKVAAYEAERLLKNPDDLSILVGLQPGSTTDVLEIVGGWAFYHAVSAPVPLDLDREESIQQIRDYVEIYEQGRIQDFARARADTFAATARNGSLLATASEQGLDIVETPYFPVNYGNIPVFGRVQADGIPDLADGAYNETFLETAFSLETGGISDAIILRDSAIVISLLDERQVEEQTIGFIVQYYPYLKQQYQSEEIEPAFVDRDKLEDDFTASFARYILGNG